MVGWLIQDEHVRLADEQTGEAESRLLAAAETRERRIGIDAAQPEAVQNRFGARAARITAQRLEVREGGVVRARFDSPLAECFGRPLEIGLGPRKVALGIGDHLANRVFGLLGERLRQVADRRVGGRQDDRARVGWVAADDAAHQRRLTGAIRTDQSDMLGVVQDEADVLEDRRRAEALAQVLDVQHRLL